MGIFPTAAYTVRLVAYVAIPLVSGAGWTWATHPEGDPAGFEYVYTSAELVAVLRCWGKVIARSLMDRQDRFTLCAFRADTGSIAGRDTWQRDSSGILVPHGNVWSLWEESERAARRAHDHRYAS